MRLLTQTTNQCLLYSFAMALDTTPEILESEVGPNAFHHQQYFQSCIARGYAPVVLDLFPVLEGTGIIAPPEECLERFENHCRGRIVILKTLTHAVAMDDSGIIFDSKGMKYLFDYKKYQSGIILYRIKSEEHFLVT